MPQRPASVVLRLLKRVCEAPPDSFLLQKISFGKLRRYKKASNKAYAALSSPLARHSSLEHTLLSETVQVTDLIH